MSFNHYHNSSNCHSYFDESPRYSGNNFPVHSGQSTHFVIPSDSEFGVDLRLFDNSPTPDYEFGHHSLSASSCSVVPIRSCHHNDQDMFEVDLSRSFYETHSSQAHDEADYITAGIEPDHCSNNSFSDFPSQISHSFEDFKDSDWETLSDVNSISRPSFNSIVEKFPNPSFEYFENMSSEVCLLGKRCRVDIPQEVEHDNEREREKSRKSVAAAQRQRDLGTGKYAGNTITWIPLSKFFDQ